MSGRASGVSFNAGTLAPKKYSKYTVSHAVVGLNTIATYKYFSDAGTLMATVEIEYVTASGQDVRGEIVANVP